MAEENLDVISTGMAQPNEIGHGQAQVFREIAPMNWGKIFDEKLNGQYARRMKQKAEEDKAQKDMLSRFDKLPDDYWDVDTPDIVDRKNKLMEKYAGDYKKYHGYNLPAEVLSENEKLRTGLESDSKSSKQQKGTWKTSYDLIRKEGEKYTPESVKGVEIYSHPKSHTDELIINSKGEEVKVSDEIKRTGSVYNFRAQNQHLLELDERYKLLDRLAKIAPTVPKDSRTIEQAGSMGGKEGTITTETVKPSKEFSDLAATAEINQYGEKAYKEIKEVLRSAMNPEQISAYKRDIGVRRGVANPDGSLTDKILQLPAGERNAAVDKEIYTQVLSDMIYHANDTKYGKRFSQLNTPAGSAKSFEDKFTVAVVPTPLTGGDYQDFNKKYKTNYTAEEFNAIKLSGEGGNYVAIEPKGAKADTESLQLTINGKQVRPIGYTVKDDKVLMTVSEAVPVEEGTDMFGKPIIKYKYKITKGIPVDQEISGNVSAHYGFETFDAFKGMLNKEISKHGGSSTTEKTTPSKGNSWDKYKRKK